MSPATEARQLPLGLPVRIQRRRTAGWRMPEGAVYVGRPTRWGNPFPHTGTAASRAEVVARRQLAGRDLACWCPPGQPCHADVLLDVANTDPEEPA